ncbi:MAG: alpha/beta hydrolase, partial [Myxococcota bacterium]
MAFAEINGQRLHYTDTGGGNAILFLHGFMMDGRMFDAQISALEGSYRCVTFDARALGRTKWDGEAFTLYDTVSDCFALMDHLGIEAAVLAGMSQGGYAALRAALTQPDRVTGLVLMSTSADTDAGMTKDAYIEMRDTWVNAGPVDPLVEGLATALIGPREKMAAWWDLWLPRWREYSGAQIFHGMNALLERDDISERVPLITTPALVTHGTEDQGMPLAHGERLANLLPKARGLVRIEGGARVALPIKASVCDLCACSMCACARDSASSRARARA